MRTRKWMISGLLTTFALTLSVSDAQAFGRKKKAPPPAPEPCCCGSVMAVPGTYVGGTLVHGQYVTGTAMEGQTVVTTTTNSSETVNANGETPPIVTNYGTVTTNGTTIGTVLPATYTTGGTVYTTNGIQPIVYSQPGVSYNTGIRVNGNFVRQGVYRTNYSNSPMIYGNQGFNSGPQTFSSGFRTGVINSAFGVPQAYGYRPGTTVYGAVGNYAGSQLGGTLFRNR